MTGLRSSQCVKVLFVSVCEVWTNLQLILLCFNFPRGIWNDAICERSTLLLHVLISAAKFISHDRWPSAPPRTLILSFRAVSFHAGLVVRFLILMLMLWCTFTCNFASCSVPVLCHILKVARTWSRLRLENERAVKGKSFRCLELFAHIFLHRYSHSVSLFSFVSFVFRLKDFTSSKNHVYARSHKQESGYTEYQHGCD